MFCLITQKHQKKWKLNGSVHREKGPALEFSNGEKRWCKNGIMHRDNNLPALEYEDGDKEYWLFGDKYELLDNNTKEFYYLGRLHRYLLPAIEYPNGDKEWWHDGKRHRREGPAVIYGNKKFWFEHGEFIKCIV